MIRLYREHHPYDRFGPANRVTAARAVLVGALLFHLLEPPRPINAWVVVVTAIMIAVLDGVDGRLARRTGMTSAFGARFDMETDALFILTLSIFVWRYGKAGGWVLLIGLLRYLFVAAGRVLPWLNGRLTPTWRGKTIAVWQMVTLITAMGPIVPVRVSATGCAVSLGLLVWSFAIDVRRLRLASKNPNAQIPTDPHS